MRNDTVFQEFTCPKCRFVGMKQIPNEWKDTVITSFYEDWYFCTNCGHHHMFISQDEPSYA